MDKKAQSFLYVRLVAGIYLAYLSYKLFNGYMASTSSFRLIFLVSAILFLMVGVFFTGNALKVLLSSLQENNQPSPEDQKDIAEAENDAAEVISPLSDEEK